MTIERKVGMGIAGQPSGGPTNVADVFSTYLYTGNGSSQTITNDIDLAGEGGLVWLKGRSSAHEHALLDTSRGDNSALSTQNTSAAANETGFGSFLSNGFSFINGGGWYNINQNNQTYVAWTFRKKEKFFDIVTYTGNGSVRNISHSLEAVPAIMIVKCTNTSGNRWNVYHKNANASPESGRMALNTTDRFYGSGEISSFANIWNETVPTDTVFTVGTYSDVNNSGSTYVAYLFADNSSEDAEDQMIKCGGYTGTNTNNGPVIDLGWEPQFVMIKSSNGAGHWIMFDTMRGLSVDGSDRFLFANLSNAEDGYSFINVTPTGFKLITNEGQVNGNETYIYMAIRAPMMVEPEAATDVFAIDNRGGVPAFDSGFPVDFFIQHEGETGARLTGRARMRTHQTEAEITSYWNIKQFNSNVGMGVNPAVTTWLYSWMWKRAKGFMDVVAYSGTGVAKTEAHSLGVVPEMIWVKSRANSKNWAVYHPSSHAAGNTLFLNLDNGGSGVGGFQSTAVSDTTFNVDTADYTNESGWTYVAYLFATLAGISKVGSYTGNGSSQTINCGFSAGAKYVLIKRTNATGDWHVWDSSRGIIAGNESYFRLNIDGGEQHNEDAIDPHNSGFIVNQITPTNINVNSATYIFYAIA